VHAAPAQQIWPAPPHWAQTPLPLHDSDAEVQLLPLQQF
jgi:hypothetical protein